MVFCFVFFLRDVFNSVTHMNRVPTMCLPLCQAHSISVSLFVLRFVFYKTPSFPRSLASKEWIWGTMSHSQREMAISTGQWECHSGTQPVGFAADTVSNLGHGSWRVERENTWAFYRFIFYVHTSLGATYSFKEEGERVLARGVAAPHKVGAPYAHQLK